MAEGGDSVDSGGKSSDRWRDKTPDISSLYLGSEEVEPVLCREHNQEFKHFCKLHMTELCGTCSRLEHTRCKQVVDIEKAAEDIFSKIHGEKIVESVKSLIERFNDCKAVAENLKSKFPNKREFIVDKVKQARKDIDDYLDELEAKTVAEIDRNIKEDKKTIDEKINFCKASLSSLNKSSSDIDRTLSVGNKEEKFIAINRATKQVNQYSNMLLEMYEEMSEMNVKFEPNIVLSDLFQSIGSVSVERSRVTDVFTNTTPIYTGEMKVENGDNTFVIAFDILKDGRKLVLLENGRIQLYGEKNAFITETMLPVKEKPVEKKEICLSLLIDNNSEALMVSTSNGRLFKVTIRNEFVVREMKINTNIRLITNYYDSVLGFVYDSAHCQNQLCVIDKNMDNIIKTIYKDDKNLFSVPLCIGVSADKNMIYVLDYYKGCYGITVDGQVMFDYQNSETDTYIGLVVDRNGIFIRPLIEGDQVEKINFSGRREEVCTIFGDAYPLKLVDNKLVLFQYDEGNLGFYCLLK